jgi:hypothetical protein
MVEVETTRASNHLKAITLCLGTGDVIPGMCALPAELRDAQVEVP